MSVDWVELRVKGPIDCFVCYISVGRVEESPKGEGVLNPLLAQR